jgi:hypothetical protein
MPEDPNSLLALAQKGIDWATERTGWAAGTLIVIVAIVWLVYHPPPFLRRKQ